MPSRLGFQLSKMRQLVPRKSNSISTGEQRGRECCPPNGTQAQGESYGRGFSSALRSGRKQKILALTPEPWQSTASCLHLVHFSSCRIRPRERAAYSAGSLSHGKFRWVSGVLRSLCNEPLLQWRHQLHAHLLCTRSGCFQDGWQSH